MAKNDSITLEEVWEALSTMEGSFEEACIEARNERFVEYPI